MGWQVLGWLAAWPDASHGTMRVTSTWFRRGTPHTYNFIVNTAVANNPLLHCHNRRAMKQTGTISSQLDSSEVWPQCPLWNAKHDSLLF